MKEREGEERKTNKVRRKENIEINTERNKTICAYNGI
jgi:ribosome-associated protein YbcJ (S4-like RNA binding protein)